MNRRLFALPAAAAVLLLAACGTTEAPADDATTPETDAAASGPVTIVDDRGEEITLDAPAVDVVSLEWGLTEHLLSLGVTPVGNADNAGYEAWDTIVPLPEGVTDVGGRGEPSVDSIVGLDADLVVTTTDLPETVIDQIATSVPVLALRGSNAEDPLGHMERTLDLLGQATGTQEQADELWSGFQTALEDGAAALADAGLDGATFTMADGWNDAGVVSVRMFTTGSMLGAVAGELGLVNGWEGEGDPDYGLAATDVEGLLALPDDTHFVYLANDTDGGDPFVDGLGTNPVWTGLPFVESGQVYRLPDGIWQFGGTASAEAFIDATVTALTS
ncbi:periplasmic binding protein [Beutenbergia cavernae DSM 12333]|uniref:Periplasmic binding protein n=1 Tax=Beutenbergia cavernae (strain ATCC BAA-8 / DSM 12333 / CCUG 43141 / JCM 11478 / NBRC 16432 / NCIMB 13614 / HKI 0122) TaxID=471853 RepID=C5BVF8_BEUC1|nr:ABC transporter substrate-binding protein [Beutenbergia cavernae]ACQ80545.1 periplasmic binding protein [Beutenbergia cavernae DSM 12333]